MEKIQIQFKESDYNVYYEYCERYYQIHDISRKKSILTFLDLFSKGVLPVEEQDLSKVILLINQKCEEIRKASRATGDSTTTPEIEACTDILHFSRDLEKMYRLFQKQGLVANYYLILAAFTKVTESGKNSPVSVMYNLDNETVETLALPLVDLIRNRLGTDRDWRSVVRELNVIAARYNRVSVGPKFDLDTIKLVAPAVVYHFNKDVKTSDVLSVVPGYFDECELDEFETLLNKTSVYVQNELDSEIDWETIARPLRGIAAKVAEQRDQWQSEQSKLEDKYALVPASDGSLSPSSQPFGAGITSGVRKTFDITTTEEGSTFIDSPLSVTPVIESEPAESPLTPLKPHIPMIVGFCVIILFIMGSIILSGAWNPLAGGNATANATAVKATVTTAKPAATTAKPPTTTPKSGTSPAATTSKPSGTAKPTATIQSYTSSEISDHLGQIAFGPDNNKIEKPTKSFVSISMGGQRDADVTSVATFIDVFNNYSSTTKLSTNIDTKGQTADIILNFLPERALHDLNVDANTIIYKDPQTGMYLFVRTGTKSFATSIYEYHVNSDLKGNTRTRWILRAILYELGFKGETAKSTGSLFYAGQTDRTQLNVLDWKAVQLMYGRKVTNGMTKGQVLGLG